MCSSDLGNVRPGHVETQFIGNEISLPDIIKEIQEKMKDVKERLDDLGEGLPESDTDKLQLVWNMITDFCTIFKNSISGRYDYKRSNKKISKELTGGAKIKMFFYNLFSHYATDKYSATTEYSDRDIERAIILHEGDNLPGFPSADVFLYLIQPQLERLKEPSLECLHEVYAYLELLAQGIMQKSFLRFPSVGTELMETVQSVMIKVFLFLSKELILFFLGKRKGQRYCGIHY